MAQIQHSFSRNDEYYTPAYAVIPILKYLKSGATIWCPFDTEESQYVKIFSENGFHVIHGHIQTCSGICEQQLEFEYLFEKI